MKHFKLLSFVVLFSAFAVFTSCKKDEEVKPDPVANTNTEVVVDTLSLLLGQWSADEFYVDGVLDTAATFVWGAFSYIEFNEDSTGTMSAPFSVEFPSVVYPMVWIYYGSSKVIEIRQQTGKTPDGTSVGGSFIQGVVTKIDSANFWYSYSVGENLIEERYKK